MLFFSATIRLLTTEEGGKRRPITTGYRPNWSFGTREDGELLLYGGQILLGPEESVRPGVATSATIQPIGVMDPWEKLGPGDTVEIYEGPHKVGVATIRSVEHR
jgi:elongation factor Tu